LKLNKLFRSGINSDFQGFVLIGGQILPLFWSFMERIRSRFNLLVETFFEVLGDSVVFIVVAVLMVLYNALGFGS
jgi:hypothetical protein